MSKLFLLSMGLFLFLACDKTAQQKNKAQEIGESKVLQTYYTCSMHPQIKEDKAGKCPICHMNLTLVEIDDSDHDHEHDSEEVASELWGCENFSEVTSQIEGPCPIDGTPMIKIAKPNLSDIAIAKVKLRKSQLSHFHPAFFPVTSMKMQKRIRLLGSVLQSEVKESNIPARVAGRVEKVYIVSTGSFIKEGEPVLDLYSPKLITGGEEYIIARKSAQSSKSKEFKDMYEQSMERLKLWGVKNSQFESWFDKGVVPQNITIYSPSTGIVRKRNAVVGKYFKEGENFFELSDLSDVWVEMDVYEHDSSLVELGQKVQLEFSALPGYQTQGEIDFIAPVLDKVSRTLKIRATIKNTTGKLKPGMVANANLEIKLQGEPLVIPRTALIDTGKRKVVWVKISKSQYQAKTIQTGYESEGYVEVKQGLMEGEEVVMEGNFLLDAQAQLFGGYEDIQKDNSAEHAH